MMEPERIFGMAPGRARRVLLLSLAFNFLLLGIVVGVGMQADRKVSRNANGFLASEVRRLAEEEGAEDAIEIMAETKAAWRSLRQGRKEMQKEMVALISADPFDAEALNTVLAQFEVNRGATRSSVLKSYIAAIDGLPQSARTDLARSLQEFFERRAKR